MSTRWPFAWAVLSLAAWPWLVGRANNVRKTCQLFHLLKPSWCHGWVTLSVLQKRAHHVIYVFCIAVWVVYKRCIQITKTAISKDTPLRPEHAGRRGDVTGCVSDTGDGFSLGHPVHP